MTTETVETAAPKRDFKWAFIGSKGLRAGWGVLLFIAVFAAIGWGTWFGMHTLHVSGPKPEPHTIDALSTIWQEGITAGCLLVAMLVTCLIERRSPGQIGLSFKGFAVRMAQGLFFGFAALSLQIGVLWLCHAIVIEKVALHGMEALDYAWKWGVAFFLVGLAEELMFRTYLQQAIARGLNFRIGALIMGLLFMAAHMGNPGESPLGLLQVFLAGIVLTYSIWRTGTIWWAVGWHASWDWAQSYFYGVADSGLVSKGTLLTAHPTGPAWLSGGATGPEGSVLTFGSLLLTAVIIHFTLRKQDEKLDIRW